MGEITPGFDAEVARRWSGSPAIARIETGDVAEEDALHAEIAAADTAPAELRAALGKVCAGWQAEVAEHDRYANLPGTSASAHEEIAAAQALRECADRISEILGDAG